MDELPPRKNAYDMVGVDEWRGDRVSSRLCVRQFKAEGLRTDLFAGTPDTFFISNSGSSNNKVNSLNDSPEFYPELASSSGLSHVPRSNCESPRELISRDSCLQLAKRHSSSAFFGNSKNLASASCGSVPLDTGRIAGRTNVLERDPQNRAISTTTICRKFRVQ